MNMDLEAIMKVALGLTKEVGQLVRERIYAHKQYVQTKSHPHDFVTETDKQIEESLIQGLSSIFPDHKFIGEESTALGVRAELTNDPTWIIDPVDGTLNFVHGFPNVCISVGFAVNKEPVLGIINIPAVNLLFTAIKDKGAFLNDQKITASKTKKLEDSLIITEFSGSATNKARLEDSICYAKKFLPVVHGLRASGSAAYNLAMIALGGADVYFEIGIHAWDMAAGTIIVREAGGVAMDTTGGPLDLMNRRILVAGTAELALETSKLIIQSSPPRDDSEPVESTKSK